VKAISIQQPWAWAIVQGYKKIENRSWDTKHRGPILIHAGIKVDRDGLDFVFETIAEQTGRSIAGLVKDYKHQTWLGGIGGVADITDTIRREPGRDYNDPWFFGPVGLVLENANALPDPIPLKGKLGLFNVPDELVTPR